MSTMNQMQAVLWQRWIDCMTEAAISGVRGGADSIEIPLPKQIRSDLLDPEVRPRLLHALKLCLSLALSACPDTQWLLTGEVSSAEVALGKEMARRVTAETFCVGRGVGCDVVTGADSTVSRLQLLCMNFPGGLIIIDARSLSGSCILQGTGLMQRQMVLAVPPGQMITLAIGVSTAVTLVKPSQEQAVQDEVPSFADVLSPHRRKLASGLYAVRAVVRMHRTAASMAGLRRRCREAEIAKLVTLAERKELEKQLALGNKASVRDVVQNLGLVPDPDEPSERGAWECAICMQPQARQGWECTSGHCFCRPCLVRWVDDGAAFPVRCPGGSCGYVLNEGELAKLGVADDTLSRLQQFQIEAAVGAAGEKIIRCPNPDCLNAVVMEDADARQPYICGCGSEAICSSCGQAPYHHHAPCSQVQELKRKWLQWLDHGSRQFRGAQKQKERQLAAVRRTIRESLARHAELQRDEQWKEEHCRRCPRCRRPVEKLDGCNTMICGVNTHGGNRQPGCGHRFRWLDARPYASKAEEPASRLPKEGGWPGSKGQDVRHFNEHCSLCSNGTDCIVGPRFRCIHCPDFNACLQCEPDLVTKHNPAHVFEILFESEFQWSHNGPPLQVGTRARVASRSSSHYRRLEGIRGVVKSYKRGRYELALEDGTVRGVATEFVEPIVSQKQAVKMLQGASSLASRVVPRKTAIKKASSPSRASTSKASPRKRTIASKASPAKRRKA